MGPFLGLFWGPGGSKKGFLLFFFLGGAFFVLLLGCMFLVFASLFCPRSFWVLFFFFFLVFFVPFLPSGRGVVLFFFLPLLLGFLFVCFSFIFGGVFRRFFFLRGVFLLWVPFLGLFLGSRGALSKGFFCFFFGGFFWGGACSCCGSLFGLVLGSRGALRKDFFCFFFGGFFLGGVFLLWVPFWACFGAPGGSKKGFLLFFFLGGLFFVVAGVHVPRFLLSFLSSLFLGLVFLHFFGVFLFLFCPRGGASCCSFFSLFFWGLFLFVFLLFWGVFRFFFAGGMFVFASLFCPEGL